LVAFDTAVESGFTAWPVTGTALARVPFFAAAAFLAAVAVLDAAAGMMSAFK